MSVAVMTQPRVHFTPVHSAGNVKKQLRDTQRMLARPNLPADVRREQERKLAALQVTAVERAQSEQERKMVSAYRMVRFFERKKAERRLKKALKLNDDLVAKEKAIMDLNYVIHFPKDRKYIALFPTTETTDERVLEERRKIRDSINQELVAKANVSTILEAPLPVLNGAASELEGETISAKQALSPANKDSSDMESDEDESEENDEEEDSDEASDDDSNDDDEDISDESDNDSLLSDDSDDDDDEEDSDEDDEDSNEDSDDDEDDSGDSDSFDDSDEDESDDNDSDDDEIDSEDDESDDDDEEEAAPASKRSRK